MVTNSDLASFSHAELVALVQDLQQRLATMVPPEIENQPALGSQEDLLAQLEKIYPEGR
jgi:hypothetical protein